MAGFTNYSPELLTAFRPSGGSNYLDRVRNERANQGRTGEFSLPPLPHPPTHFFGCDVIIEELLSLVEGFVSVILLGAGGTGKTAIALTLLHHVQTAAKFGNRRYFMRCDDLVNSLDGFLGRLSDAIGAHNFKDVARLRTHLSLSSPCILVLDGVDSILDPLAPGAAEIATVIEEFCRCQDVLLFATSRMEIGIPGFRRMEVPTLSADSARDLLHSCSSLGRSDAVDKLLAELDFHPLSIDLLASVARENYWDEATLLEAWNDGKTNILKASGCRSLEDNINSILGTPTIQELGTTALETLQAIAAFPNGVEESKLEMMFPTIAGIGETAAELCKFSLVYRRDGFIKMLSPFRIYFLESMVLSNVIHSHLDRHHEPPPPQLPAKRKQHAVSKRLSSFLPPTFKPSEKIHTVVVSNILQGSHQFGMNDHRKSRNSVSDSDTGGTFKSPSNLNPPPLSLAEIIAESRRRPDQDLIDRVDRVTSLTFQYLSTPG